MSVRLCEALLNSSFLTELYAKQMHAAPVLLFVSLFGSALAALCRRGRARSELSRGTKAVALRAVGHWPVQFPHLIQYWTGATRTALLITNLFLERKFLLTTNFIFRMT
jgi:hypothetical protein